MPQIVSSDADRVVGRINTDDDVVLEDVWYAEESVCLTVVPPEEGACSFGGLCMNAVAIDRRERTRSNGYVEQTEVTPANAPLASLLGVSNSLVPCRVNHFFNCS